MVTAMLQRSAYEQRGLFVEKGVDLEVREIRGALNSGADFPAHCAHSMAEVSAFIPARFHRSSDTTVETK